MNIDDSTKVGSRIKQIRKDKGISQTDMANLLGVKRPTYSNYENDNRTPDLEILKKISIVLEVDISELLGMDHLERMKFESDFDIKDLDPKILKIFNDFKDNFMKN